MADESPSEVYRLAPTKEEAETERMTFSETSLRTYTAAHYTHCPFAAHSMAHRWRQLKVLLFITISRPYSFLSHKRPVNIIKLNILQHITLIKDLLA